MIKEKFPDKPIKYVILSHNHTDHIQGLAAFRDDDITFLTSPTTLGRIEEFMNAPMSLTSVRTPNLQSDGKYQIKVIKANSSVTIKNGKTKLLVSNLGDTPHVKGLLYAHLLPDNVVIQADGYFEFSKWGLAFDYLVEWASSLKTKNLKIAGIHHPPISFEALLKVQSSKTAGVIPHYIKSLEKNATNLE